MSKENQEEKISIFKSFLLKSWDLSKKILDRLLFFGRNDEINSLRNRINKYLNLFHNFRKRYEKYSNLKADSLIYKCNICGNTSVSTFKELHREVPTCTSCGSNVRFRSIVHLLSLEIFDESICLEDFPIRKDISVLGFSDWEGYTDKLAEKLNYLNTYFHKDPRLDISQIDHELEGKFDYVIASELFEHVPSPVSISIQNAFKLLKDGGTMILTVPYKKDGEQTIEHFKNLNKYRIVEKNNKRVLENITKEGEIQIFNNLIFHGGDGVTVEMRMFCENSILRELEDAGFKDIKIFRDNYFKFGIYWQVDWHLPIIARRPSDS